MDLKQIEEIAKETEDSIAEEEEGTAQSQVDSGSALQLFLDKIPISSIPSIKNSPVVELKTGDRVKDALQLLYEKNAYGALISDISDDDINLRFSERYIAFIDFASVILWCLEECEKSQAHIKRDGKKGDDNDGFFTMLEQNPHIGQAKIGELAKSFLWDPFLPVYSDDTLFHVLLLLSKHRVQVVPVIQRSDSRVIGFVTQNAVIHALLQSSGLEWFDNIADKALLEFRKHIVSVREDQSLAEALQVLWKSRTGATAVVNSTTKSITGIICCSDVYLLLENNNLLYNMKSLTVEEFIHLEIGEMTPMPTDEQEMNALLSAGTLRLRNSFLPRMDSPATNKNCDTLKQAMKNVAERRCSFSLLVDDLGQVTGVLTLRDIILQFAPPCVDSSIHGGGFFDSALEQAGCRIQNGAIIFDN